MTSSLVQACHCTKVSGLCLCSSFEYFCGLEWNIREGGSMTVFFPLSLRPQSGNSDIASESLSQSHFIVGVV